MVGRLPRGSPGAAGQRVLGLRRSVACLFFEARLTMNDHEARRARRNAIPTGYRRLPRPKPSAAVLDRVALMARVGDDQDLLRELVAIFLEDCPGWVEEIRTSVQRGDARNLKMFAHLLGGTVSNFGAREVTEAARKLEKMGHSGNLAGADEACEALLIAVDELRPALLDLLHHPVA